MIDKLQYISQQPNYGDHLSAIRTALNAGCKWIQLRVKDLPDEQILAYAMQAQALCEQQGAKLIVNDHPEIALQSGAYGVHLGLMDMPVAEAKEMAAGRLIIGGTANTFEHIRQRVSEGVDYIGLGPYRFTRTKQNLSPVLGLQGYAGLMQQVRLAGIRTPILAIGGIEEKDIPLILSTGIYGVAVSGAITHAKDAQKTVSDIYNEINFKTERPV